MAIVGPLLSTPSQHLQTDVFRTDIAYYLNLCRYDIKLFRDFLPYTLLQAAAFA